MSHLDYEYIAELVTQAQTGDNNAFAELYAATYQKEYAFAYQYLKDTYLAQDAIQETYILVLKNISTLKEPTLFISWLHQICFRVCFNMQRKQQRQLESSLQLDDLTADTPVFSVQTPEEQVVVVEHQKYILKQVMNLPFSESQAIILRYYNNLKIDDIANLMNVSKSTVKRHINSGLKRLKRLLEK